MNKVFCFFILLLSIPNLSIAETYDDNIEKANYYFTNNNLDKAIECYTEAIEINPKNAAAYYNRGRSFEYKNKHKEAISDFIKAINLDEKYKNILYSQGAVYYLNGQADISLQYFMNHAEIYPDEKNSILINLNKKKDKFNFIQNVKFIIKKNTNQIKYTTLIPDNYEERQKIINTIYSIEPTKVFKSNNNKYAEFIFIKPKGIIEFNINNEMEIYQFDLKTALNNKNIQNVNNSDMKEYLNEEKFIEKNDPALIRVAERFYANNQIDLIEKIYNFVLKHMDYQFYQFRKKGALYALKNKGDDCSEYSDLFIALCRAKNIPARFIGGFILKEGKMDIGHAWTEVFINDLGWVSFDPTFDDTDENLGITTFKNLQNVYIYMSFLRNDKNLNDNVYYNIEYKGDKIETTIDNEIKIYPKENYYYFLKLISSFKTSQEKYKKEINNLINIKNEQNNSWNAWESDIANLLTNNINANELINNAQNNMEKLCEAYCYIGYKYLFEQDFKNAKKYFHNSIKTNYKKCIEFDLASCELRNLEIY